MAKNQGKLQSNSNMTEEEKKAYFERESKSFLKEVEELSTVCGVDACAIIYNPFGGDGKPTVWPSTEGVLSLMSRYLNPQIPELETISELEALGEEGNKDKDDEMEMERRKTDREIEMKELMFDCLHGKRDLSGLSNADLKDLIVLVERGMSDMRNLQLATQSAASTSGASAADAGNGEEEEQVGEEAATENKGEQVPQGSNQHVAN